MKGTFRETFWNKGECFIVMLDHTEEINSPGAMLTENPGRCNLRNAGDLHETTLEHLERVCCLNVTQSWGAPMKGAGKMQWSSDMRCCGNSWHHNCHLLLLRSSTRLHTTCGIKDAFDCMVPTCRQVWSREQLMHLRLIHLTAQCTQWWFSVEWTSRDLQSEMSAGQMGDLALAFMHASPQTNVHQQCKVVDNATVLTWPHEGCSLWSIGFVQQWQKFRRIENQKCFCSSCCCVPLRTPNRKMLFGTIRWFPKIVFADIVSLSEMIRDWRDVKKKSVSFHWCMTNKQKHSWLHVCCWWCWLNEQQHHWKMAAGDVKLPHQKKPFWHLKWNSCLFIVQVNTMLAWRRNQWNTRKEDKTMSMNSFSVPAKKSHKKRNWKLKFGVSCDQNHIKARRGVWLNGHGLVGGILLLGACVSQSPSFRLEAAQWAFVQRNVIFSFQKMILSKQGRFTWVRVMVRVQWQEDVIFERPVMPGELRWFKLIDKQNHHHIIEVRLSSQNWSFDS